MAFTKLNLKLGRGSYNSKNSISTLTTHTYRSAIDDFAIIAASNYFPSNLDQPVNIVRVGDLMQIQDSTDEERIYLLTNLDPFTVQLDSGNLVEERLIHTTGFGGIYAAPVIVTLELRKIGTQVICGFPLVIGTAVAAVVISETVPIPSTFAPTVDIGPAGQIIQVVDNGAEKDGFIEVVQNGTMNIYASSALATFAGSGLSGFNSFYMSWISD